VAVLAVLAVLGMEQVLVGLAAVLAVQLPVIEPVKIEILITFLQTHSLLTRLGQEERQPDQAGVSGREVQRIPAVGAQVPLVIALEAVLVVILAVVAVVLPMVVPVA
jgi:hypothetical protein